LNIIGHGSPTIFKGVILLIFEKALDEPKYSSMYAQLCKRLAEHAPNFESPDAKITTFKRLLLNKCRDEFENRAALSATYDKRSGALTGEEEEARFLAKRKMLGNIKFIGELGKLEMLHDSILHRCCEQLLVGRKRQPISEQGEDLECLAYLFKTCGRLLDSPKAKLLVDQYIERIEGIIANDNTPTRIKFLLQDVIDMRENRWIPRKLAVVDGPKTIQQVREDAARDGCIYLPQNDNQAINKAINAPSKLEEVLFSKSRNKGMEDIFGGPGPQGPASLGTGPGVIGGDEPYNPGDHYNNYRNGHSFEEKFNSSNANYRNENRDYKPRHDSFENKFAERPDFGDRFTANRNKTHPSNRGRGSMNGGGGMTRSSNSYERNGSGSYDRNGGSSSGSPHMNGMNGSADKDLPPRFKRMGGFSDHQPQSLRPSAMMLKPKTPSSLPKSAMQRMENGMMMSGGSSTPKLMMTTAEPPVFISKKSNNTKQQNKMGPTREEVFGKIEDVLAKLSETGSTNEAYTAWKEGDIPNKMVNNALIHLFKQVIKMEGPEQRQLALQLVDQLVTEDLVTQVHCKEGLSRVIQSLSNLETSEGGVVSLCVWSLGSDKVKLDEVAEMTEGGATHPLFLDVLQSMAAENETKTLADFKASGVKLLDQLPQELRSDDELGRLLGEKKLAFLVPMLSIKGDLWRQLETNPAPDTLLAWVRNNVPEQFHADSAFVYALVGNIVRYIAEKGLETEPEKEMIVRFKPILKAFLTVKSLQLNAIYALQVYFHTIKFPKGLLLRWFVALYESDIVDENTFLTWKEDVNDTYPGKGKALFQVNQWLTWLEEAESEDEDEDE